MIDPQLQGIKWVIRKETPHGLVILQQSQSKYIDKVCKHFLVQLCMTKLKGACFKVEKHASVRLHPCQG